MILLKGKFQQYRVYIIAIIDSYNGLDLNPLWHSLPVEYDVNSLKVAGYTVSKVATDIVNYTYATGGK